MGLLLMKTQFTSPNGRVFIVDSESFTCTARGGNDRDGSPCPELVVSFVTMKTENKKHTGTGEPHMRAGKPVLTPTKEVDPEATQKRMQRTLDDLAHLPSEVA